VPEELTFLTDTTATVHTLHIYPIKSCGGIALTHSPWVETGLDYDRQWMVVTPQGAMLTQRDLPRMALVQPSFKGSDLLLRAPGMLALHLRLDAAEAPTRVQVWRDVVKAYDMGELAAQWFSSFLGQPLRLVRFDPEQERLSSSTWTGEHQAHNAFSDGYPMLVTNTASLADLNARLAATGQLPVGMDRFRPNLVLHGLQAFDEDHIDELLITTPQGPVRLRLVKPCIRCEVPDIDPATALSTTAVGQALAAYRADARVDGGITFGMNAVVLEGWDCSVAVGQPVQVSYRF
jgi:uncharacterized protein